VAEKEAVGNPGVGVVALVTGDTYPELSDGVSNGGEGAVVPAGTYQRSIADPFQVSAGEGVGEVVPAGIVGGITSPGVETGEPGVGVEPGREGRLRSGDLPVRIGLTTTAMTTTTVRARRRMTMSRFSIQEC